MQLELGVGSRARNASPRVLALYFPDLPLQRLLRAREAAGRRGSPRTPLAVERNGEVVACNAEARARGIQRGDTLGRARLACAELEAVPADEAGDRAALMGIAEALLVLSPTVEISWPDVLLLDASGAHLFAREGTSGEPAMAERAVALASDLGLRCRVAIASGRGPARVLARHGLVSGPVAPEDAPAMLASLPIMALELPPGVADRFACLGLREIGEVARLPAATLAHRFGAPGLAAWRLAHGDDPSPLVPHVPREPPAERLELEAPLEGSQPLLFGLRRLCDRLAVRLAGRGLGATRLALVLGLDPRGEQRLEIALASPSSAAARWLLVLRERLDSLRLPAAVTSAVLSVMEA
ncbi:MAG TPA: DNA polymerase Y family protein, partial [Anaeromyxobacteraceae bacterium]|nr:DNA polymerase Y family protein [Anaeromyxobacteraceae bacterium]